MIKRQNQGGNSVRAFRASKLKRKLVLCTKGLNSLNSGKLISTIGVSRKSILERGMTIDLRGRLNGVRRARGMVEQEGGVSGNTLCKKYKYSVNNITTKWGIWQLKVSLN